MSFFPTYNMMADVQLYYDILRTGEYMDYTYNVIDYAKDTWEQCIDYF